MKTAIALLLLVVFCAQAQGAGKSIVFYRIGESGEQAWTLLREYFEAKGYSVAVIQGDTAIEKHVDRINRINRSSGGSVFLAMELVPDEKSHVMVAESDARMGEGRFLAIDEIPARFARESDRLASAVAAPFAARVKHLPLYPLLGVNLPGIAVKLEFDQGETLNMIAKVYKGVERYFSERTK